MRRLMACLALGLCLVAPLRAQIIDSGSITAGGADCTTAARCTVFAVSPGTIGLMLAVSGTYSGTLQFETSSDNGTTWFAASLVKLADGSTATSTTTTGQYAIGNAGLTHVRARCSAYTSGTATITAARGYATARWLTPFSQTAPTVTSAGTSPSIAGSNGTGSFRVNVGTGGTATTIVLGMPTAPTGWNCNGSNLTAAAANRNPTGLLLQQSSTTTAATMQYQTVATGVALAFTASDIVQMSCAAF